MNCNHSLKLTSFALCVLAFVEFGGCASASRLALNGTEKQISSTQACIALNTQEIGADIRGSNVGLATAATGGLIGAIIGSAIDAGVESGQREVAQANIVSIRKSLASYDVGKVFSDSLRAELSRDETLKVTKIEARYVSDASDMRSWVANAAAETVLVVATEYRMTPNFDGVMICVRASLRANTPTLIEKGTRMDDLPAALYYNQLSTLIPGPRPSGKEKVSIESRIKLWLADDGKPLRQALDGGLAEIAKMIIFDLKQPAPANKALYKSSSASQKVATFPTEIGSIGTAQGYVVHMEGSSSWVRMPGGQLVSTSK